MSMLNPHEIQQLIQQLQQLLPADDVHITQQHKKGCFSRQKPLKHPHVTRTQLRLMALQNIKKTYAI